VKAGVVAPGLIVIISGKVEITQESRFGGRETIVTHEPGKFVGELAQLSARPSLVDAEALEPVGALVIRSERLRDLMVQEAELGERIMRALILRRVGLLESGASGPVIVGPADDADVLRLQVFLARNGQPHALEGHEGNLESVCWRNRASGEETTRSVRHLFLFIGADPNTDRLVKCDVALDGNGFVRTGHDCGEVRHALETSRSGVFAIGDVRSGSVKRVAAAVGEGAQVVAALHAYLAQTGGSVAPAPIGGL
jgi:CRP-like cAMP-binding protein